MNDQAYNNRWATANLPRVIYCVAMAVLISLAGCKSKPNPNENIPLPGFGNEGPAKPTGVYAVVRRADVPLDESSDEAWAIVNEQVVPAVTRGTWRGNGLRIGLLQRNQLDAYSEVMPQPVAFSRLLINRSEYPVPIIETARLRSDLRFEMDLTRPPRPRFVEKIRGGESSTLRLLAKIETEADGRHTFVLTPMHHIPSRLGLIPRNPLEKELDGRIYDELSLRITLGKDQIAVVGLHWPWPIGEVIEEDEPSGSSELNRVSLQTSTAILAADSGDPAAPPLHLRPIGDASDDGPREGDVDQQTDINGERAEPRYQRIAPPLITSFGSTLLTGTRIRQPVRTVLLITIEDPTTEGQALPALSEE